jgi:hypothetical protein
LPVAPLALGDRFSMDITAYGFGGALLPAWTQLPQTIPGDAPALADISVATQFQKVWGLFAWTPTPGTPMAGTVAPWGILNAKDANTITGMSIATASDYYSGQGVQVNYAGAGTPAGSGSVVWGVDPSTITLDDFAAYNTDVEVWARVSSAWTTSTANPVVRVSLTPGQGTAYGPTIYTAEYGTSYKAVPRKTLSTYTFMRLGTLPMPVVPSAPLKWNLRLDASWGANGTGWFGIDYVMLVPARTRALGPTGKRNDATYPTFIKTGGSGYTKKLVKSDLSGWAGWGANGNSIGNLMPDSGLGGSPIEMPPGNVSILLKLSGAVPDDPVTTNDLDDATTAQAVTTVSVTPRYWVAKGA